MRKIGFLISLSFFSSSLKQKRTDGWNRKLIDISLRRRIVFLFICSDFFVGVNQAIKRLNMLQPHRQQSGRSELLFRSNLVSILILLTSIAFHVSFCYQSKNDFIFLREIVCNGMVAHKKNGLHVRLRHLRKLLPITTAVCNNRNFAALMGTTGVICILRCNSRLTNMLNSFIHTKKKFITQLSTTKQWHTFGVKKSHSLTVWQY